MSKNNTGNFSYVMRQLMTDGSILTDDYGSDLKIQESGDIIAKSVTVKDLVVTGTSTIADGGNDLDLSGINTNRLTKVDASDDLVESSITDNGTTVSFNNTDLSSINSITATSITGTLTTPNQPNIIGLGSLVSLNMVGDISMDDYNITV